MGGKQFKKQIKKEEDKYLPFSLRLQQFERDINLLQEKVIDSRFNKENKMRDTSNPTKEEISNIIEFYKEKSKSEGLKNPSNIFAHFLCQHFVERYVIKSDNIFKILNEIIDKLTLSKEERERLDLIKELFEKEFEQNLKFVKYNLNSKEFKNLDDLNFVGVHSNLLFNKNLQPEVITVILDDNLLDKYDHVKRISDVIAHCPNLLVVNYILYPRNRDGKLAEEFGLDGQNYQSLFALIKAVIINKNIKSFFLHSVEYYNLNLAPEICRLIEQKLQSETLIAFHFGNFNLNANWIKKIEFLLTSTKSLLFLSYENKKYTKSDVLDFKKIIAKNRSIRILSIVTPIFKGMKKEVIEEIKTKLIPENKDSKLQIIYVNHESLIDISWFALNQQN